MSSSFWRFIVMIGAALILLCMLGLLIRRPRAGRYLLAHAILGLGTLWAFQLVLPGYGLAVPINALSLLASGLFGAPGAALSVALMAVL